MKKITTKNESVKVNSLSINPFLKKYGITEVTDFEIGQLQKFNLPAGHIICTQDKSVLYNYEAVETARKMGLDLVEATILDIPEDMVIQVISFKNMRQRLSRMLQAEVIMELRRYMNETEAGKKWKEEIPGDEINTKIGFLVGYSYGMVNQVERIYKHNPQLLQMIDDGDLKFTEAIGLLPKLRTKDPVPVTDSSALYIEEAPEIPTMQNSVKLPVLIKGDDGVNGIEEVPTDECEGCIIDNGVYGAGIRPEKVEIKKWDFAGEIKTEPCESIEEVVVRFASGKEIKLSVTDGNIIGNIFGKPTGNIIYTGGKKHTVDGSEFHIFKSAAHSLFQIIFHNRDNMAA